MNRPIDPADFITARLPAPEEPKGRWKVPFVDINTKLWTVCTCYPVPQKYRDLGVLSTVTAKTRDGLTERMKEQDKLAAGYGLLPAWAHRNSG